MFEPIYNSIIPLVYYDENKLVHIAGTSILVDNDRDTILITASHVLREIGDKYPIYILLARKAIILPGPALLSKLPDKKNPLDLDIAYFPLAKQSELLKHLEEYKPLSFKEFDESISYAKDHYYVFGYPWRRAKYSRDSSELNIKPLGYFTDKLNDPELYEKYNRSSDTHILVKYRPKESKNADGNKITAPKPHGISGGPLFRALVNEKNEVFTLIWEGLLTDWKESRIIIATQKSTIKNFIEGKC